VTLVGLDAFMLTERLVASASSTPAGSTPAPQYSAVGGWLALLVILIVLSLLFGAIYRGTARRIRVRRGQPAHKPGRKEVRARQAAWAVAVAPVHWPAIKPPARPGPVPPPTALAPSVGGGGDHVVEAVAPTRGAPITQTPTQPGNERADTADVPTPKDKSPSALNGSGAPKVGPVTPKIVTSEQTTGAEVGGPGDLASAEPEQADDPAGDLTLDADAVSGTKPAGQAPQPLDANLPGLHVEVDAEDELEAQRDDAGPVRVDPVVNVLGPVEVSGWRQEPERRVTTELVVYLALHAERPRSSDEVRGALWAADSDGGGRDVSAPTLHQHLSRLRRCLGAEHLPDAEAGRYRLAGVSCDWTRFRELTQLARQSGASDAIGALSEALGLVRGTPFAGAGDRYGWAWTELLVSQMSVAITDAAHRLARLALQDGDAALANWSAERGLSAVPTEESLHEDRMAAAVLGGDRTSFERFWRDAVAALGPQAEQGPLGATHRRLTVELDKRLIASE
jgi:DNA-binding SARP family transcriptional activator